VRGPACPVLFRPTRGSRGAGQLATGWLSDHTGRKPLIATGMLVQAAALGLLVAGDGAFTPSLAAAALLGVGTAMVYPTLIAAVSDATQPRDRARVVGVYRFWRDFGFVLGALIAGIGADATSPSTADPDRRLAHRRQRPARRRNLLAATRRVRKLVRLFAHATWLGSALLLSCSRRLLALVVGVSRRTESVRACLAARAAASLEGARDLGAAS